MLEAITALAALSLLLQHPFLPVVDVAHEESSVLLARSLLFLVFQARTVPSSVWMLSLGLARQAIIASALPGRPLPSMAPPETSVLLAHTVQADPISLSRALLGSTTPLLARPMSLLVCLAWLDVTVVVQA